MERLIHLFSLLLFFNTLVIGQTLTYSGRLLTKSNNSPIEYGRIYLKGKPYGVLSNVDGLFNLHNISQNDTLIISCVGYETLVLKLDAEKIKQQDIFLNPKIYNLTSAEIESGVPRIIKSGFLIPKIENDKVAGIFHGRISNGYSLINTGFQRATFIENREEKVGLIQSVAFFLHKEGIANTPFRLRLYSVNDKGAPKEDLLNKSIIVIDGRNDKWVKVDLRDYQIELPPNGFFIAMEWLQTNNEAFIYHSKYKKVVNKRGKERLRKEGHFKSKLIGFGQVLGFYEVEKKNASWTKFINRDWTKHLLNGVPMIRCEIKIWD